jgi:outer membrane biogenesis lipoprotein LolB
MESKFLKIALLFVIVFSLAACTAKTTETTAVEQETKVVKKVKKDKKANVHSLLIYWQKWMQIKMEN